MSEEDNRVYVALIFELLEQDAYPTSRAKTAPTAKATVVRDPQRKAPPVAPAMREKMLATTAALSVQGMGKKSSALIN